jgi:DNA-binding CsgD family transcriptional regulator
MSNPVEKAILCPVLIGRAVSLDALRQRIEQARQGRGRTLVLAGEAGVGKSRLVAEASTHATQLGMVVARGSCFEPDQTLPFAPLIDLLQSWCAGRSADEMAAMLGTSAATLARLLPALQPLVADSVPSLPDDPDQEKRRLFSALVDVLLRIGVPLSDPAISAPALIVIEDLHWCDDPSLEFHQLFVRRIAGHPTMLLLTYRSEEVSDRLRHLLATLDRMPDIVDEFAIERLDRDQVQAMIAAIFEQRRPVRSEFVDALYHLTDGNPFFVEETLKALVASGDIFLDGGTWTRKAMGELRIPRTVHDAVQSRAQHLDPSAHQLLRLAAVMGRRFNLDILQEVSQRDEVQILGAIKALIAAQLVSEESADVFAFRHALTRQAIYTSMLARERRPLHRSIAEALARRGVQHLDAHAGDLAYHFYEAGEWAQAMAYARRAGERAQTLFATHAASEHYTHAIQAAEHLDTEPPADLYYLRGQAREILGEVDPAREDFERACTLARANADIQTEWQSLLALGFLWVGRDYQQAGTYLQSALAAAHVLNDPATIAHTLNRLGNWHIMTDEPAQSVDRHQDALVIFQSIDDRRGMAATLDLLGIAHCMSGSMVRGAYYYEQAIRLWRALGERQWLITSLATYATRGGNYLFATALCQPVALEQCVGEAEEALALARQIGWLNGEATALLWMGHTLGPHGAWARALAAAQQALELAQGIDHPLWILTAHAIQGAVLLDLGAFGRAQQTFEHALEQARATRSAYVILSMSGYLAATLIAQRMLDQAAAALDAVSDASLPARTQAQQLVWRSRAELALARDDPATALQIIDQLLTSVGAPQPHPTQDFAAGVVPGLWLLRGRALAACGKLEDAFALLQGARDAADALQAHPLRWRIQAALAQLYQAQRRYADADLALDEARATIAALAAHAPDDELRETFTQYALSELPALRAPTPRQAAKRTFGGLTERERHVAILVAQGKTTRAIAAELILSERTVEKHIANIMAKLAVDTRTQIGVWAAEHDLTHT